MKSSLAWPGRLPIASAIASGSDQGKASLDYRHLLVLSLAVRPWAEWLPPSFAESIVMVSDLAM